MTSLTFVRFHEPLPFFLPLSSPKSKFPTAERRFLLCLLCNRGLAGCQEHVEWKCEVKLAFAEGERLSTLPSSPVPTSCVDLFPVITRLFVFLLGTRFGCPIGFQRRHHRGGGKVCLETIAFPDAFCSRPSLSLSLFPPPFKSHFHAKLAVFSLSLSNSRSKFRASSNWTADIYARSEIFRFNIRPEEDFVSLVEPQSMNGGCVVVPPRATTNIYVSWKKFLPVLSVFRNKRSCCRWYSFRGVFAANVINVKKNSSTTISFRAIKYKKGIYTHAKYRRGNGDVSNSRSNPNPSPLPLHTFPRLVKKYNYIYLFILINVIILIII